MKVVDLDGKKIYALGNNEQNTIRNALSKGEARYVAFGNKGLLNNDLLLECPTNSKLLTALVALSNSPIDYLYYIRQDDFSQPFYDDRNGNYYYGVTLMPNAKENPSPDNNVYIITSSLLSPQKAVMNFAHEALGHAYFYELQRNGKNVNPNHTRRVVEYKIIFDPEFGNITYPIWDNSNIELENWIKSVEMMALDNYLQNENN